MSAADIDLQIAERASVAPRVTPAQVEASIFSEHYFTARDGVVGELESDGVDATSYELTHIPLSLGLLTFCVLVLRNGFTVTGESACASPENFRADIGRQIARQNAVAKIWPLLGYELRTQLDDAARKDACGRACEG